MAPSKKQRPARISNAERNATTRAALVEAGRELFGANGYSAVGTEEIVRKAGVTRGAMYHHFKTKRDLFAAVFDEVEGEMAAFVLESVTPVAARGTAWDAALAGVGAFLEFCADETVERISILDAPSVLDTETRREIAGNHGTSLVMATLTALIESGAMRPQPVEALTQLLIGALVEGATFVAESEDPVKARQEVLDLIEKMLRGMA